MGSPAAHCFVAGDPSLHSSKRGVSFSEVHRPPKFAATEVIHKFLFRPVISDLASCKQDIRSSSLPKGASKSIRQ